MKPIHQSKFLPPSKNRLRVIIFSATVMMTMGEAFSQTTRVWTAGGNGALGDGTKYTGGIAPVNGDSVSSDGTGSIIGYDATSTVTSLATLNLNITSGATVFNQASGTLSLSTLGFGGGGASRNPTYNMDGGTLNISTSFGWGNGSNARFNQSAGTVNHSGGSLSIGVASGAKGYITMTGGTFNANSVAQVNLGNSSTGNGQAYIDLSGSSIFNATTSIFVVGQFGTTAGTSFGSVTLANTSALNASTIVLGGNNNASAVFGVITLNGGTISAGSIRKGSSTLAASITQNVLHANGGTVKALTHANNSNYFQNVFVDVQSGGLTFDTNNNNVTIDNLLSGPGGLTKAGAGTLSLTSSLSTYQGNTTVSAGRLTMPQATLNDASTVSVNSGATINLSHGGQDQVAEIILNGAPQSTAGTYGSSASSAIFKNDTFFEGTGVLRIGPASPGRDLTWTGAVDDIWSANGPTNFTTNGSDSVAFSYNDDVTFNDSSAVTTVRLSGMLYPDVVTFSGTQNYSLVSLASPTGISGGASIVMNNTASVSLGGADSAFTGPIAVNAGRLIALNNKSFGATSGITIANGAQVDLNGKSPGSIYTYTLNGSGPAGSGAIVNTAATDLFSAGGVKHLILGANSSIGSNGGRFDIGGSGGTITGNGYTLTKVGTNSMAFRDSMNVGSDSIAIVVAGGAIWAEGSATAFGGANSSLTIQSGAAAGTFGSNLTIPTTVTVENGGTLRSGAFETVSSLTGTWTNNITLNGEVTLSGLGGPLVLTGNASGTANVTKTGANNVTISDPNYTGNTTVAAGRLTVGGASLDDAGDVAIATGAILNLTHGDTDVVDTLVLGGVPAAPGSWGSTASGADNQNDTYFQGNGMLDVQHGPVGYSTWIGAYTLEGDDILPGSDPDNDGLGNAVERVIGGNPTVSSQAGRPIGFIDGTDLVFTFSRVDASEAPDILVEVEYSNDLATWTAVTVGASGAGIVNVAENEGDPDLITVTIPLDGDTTKFARLKVTVTAE